MNTVQRFDGTEIAIIGMRGRFPGANDLDAFWKNLSNGTESITLFSDEELDALGVDRTLRQRPGYVKAASLLEGMDQFAASFFGYTAREAELMDPQHRLFLECAWEALEHAGYDTNRYTGLIGVYAGATLNSYLLLHLAAHYWGKEHNPLEDVQLGIGNAADFLTTRVSYKLNLTGPSHTVQTACSTSLVAIHIACQNLLHGECDMALAGGVSLNLAHRGGYLYMKEGVVSPDGHCRAFDVQAQGTIFGSGVGIVVLKRLEEALRDGDFVHALIRGSAINNDGALKAGYTAPGVDGQARVIAESLANAEVSAETISYIETHGTGTALGDPIEIQALTKAFQEYTTKKGFCKIGSVKTNVGHLDVAAGVTGLIKSVLMLEHQQIPPSLHFQQPNPTIDFANSPFSVSTTLQDWPAGTSPRRAGVSSFGIGGTNAHIILEEAPPREVATPSRPWQLFLLSAKTPSALDAATHRLATHLATQPQIALADVAYTYQVGRREFTHRRMLVSQDRAETIQLLEQPDPMRVVTAQQNTSQRNVVFLFPGQGSQYVDMGRQLYACETIFRQAVEHVANLFQPHLGADLLNVLYPETDQADEASQRLAEAKYSMPAIFTIEYALAQLWQSWGVLPQAMLGHSTGEYTAACLAGVFSLEDAVHLLALRGQLIQEMSPGAMLAVDLPEADLLPRLGRLSLAAVNKPANCVVAGPVEEVQTLYQQLEAEQIPCKMMSASRAFHSSMMEPVLERFVAAVRQVRLKPPHLPYISNVTGDWIRKEEATDPAYWGKHLRQTVRFSDGIRVLQQLSASIFLEVGPGNVLSRFARSHLSANAALNVIPSLRHPRDPREDEHCLLEAAGKLWLNGVSINWEGFYMHERRQRLPLPTYPFERQRYWIEASREQKQAEASSACQDGESDMLPIIDKDSDVQTPVAGNSATTSRQAAILKRLKELVSNVLGEGVETLNSDANFFQLGLDSLVLIQTNHMIKDIFDVEISMRQLFEDLSTLSALAAYIDQCMPPDEIKTTLPSVVSSPVPDAAPATHQVSAPGITTAASSTPMQELFAQQLQLLAQQMEIQRAVLSQQLELLRSEQAPAGMPASTTAFPSSPRVAQKHPGEALPQSSAKVATLTNGAQLPIFVAFQPLRTQAEPITPQQQRSLEALIARYTARTQKSREHVQASRVVRANHRNSMAFHLLWKEMVYPVIASSSQGAHIQDIDGNEYIDLTMGFGVALFGHAVPFVQEALSKALQQGWLIGPYMEKAEQVARLIAALTGVERVAFYNSGTEAVMVALRLARAATGRTKIAIFAGAFHGTFDGLQARMDFTGGEVHAVPLAPGISPNMVKDVLVLNYGTPHALEMIKTHAHELAAVLVEPVQSRRPDLQPREFLQQLRQVTTEIGAMLIFDEMITGFRIHPGGAQAYFDVRADLVTYGKVIGGGMPIGVVAGRAAVMDSIDGGTWSYGDASYPPHDSRRTIVGGTFCEHPLAMAAAEAVLIHLKEQGPALQQRLNERTAYFAASLNTFFQNERVPVRVVHFGSLIRFLSQGDLDLLYYYLLDKGVYVWEGRSCFLSTAHTEQDINDLIQAVKESVQEMRAGGFLPDTTPPLPPIGGGSPFLNQNPAHEPETLSASFSEQGEPIFPLSHDQRQLWFLTQMSAEAACAYSESAVVHMQGACNLAALRLALQKLVDRHEALRTAISLDGETQCVKAALPIAVPLLDWSSSPETAGEQEIEQWLLHEIRKPFQLDQPPLLRSYILKRGENIHDFVVIVHHMAADGWSWALLFQELATLYSATCQGISAQLSQVTQFRAYLQWQSSKTMSREYAETKAYWTRLLSPPPSPLLLPTVHPRRAFKTYRGRRLQHFLPAALYSSLQQLSREQSCSLFITTLAIFQIFLHRLTNQDDFVIGVPVAGQPLMKAGALIGHCTNMLPVRCQVAQDAACTSYMQAVRSAMLDIYQHQSFSFASLAENEQALLPPITTMFNMDRSVALPVFSGLQIEITPGPVQFAKFDVSLNIIEVDGALRLDFDYNTDLFGPTTGQHWFSYFETLLHEIVNDPSVPLSSLPQIGALEQSAWSTSTHQSFLSEKSGGLEGGLEIGVREETVRREDLEVLLCQHPAVHEAVVIDDQKRRLLTYVVPCRDLAENAPHSAEHIAHWQMIFSEAYRFDIFDWNSRYTNQPIPKRDVDDIVERTVERILGLNPGSVLEIGCGSGLLLLPIARHCTHYCGTDFSEEGFASIQKHMATDPSAWAQVTLLQQSADDFTGLTSGSFDTVILNSVVQYFPGIDYLLRVLAGTLKVVGPGGCIFVGEVRSLPLLETFHTDLALQCADDDLPLARLQQRVNEQALQEKELVIDPEFFRALPHHFPQLSHVDIQLKRGCSHNEITNFRYDVILYVGREQNTLPALSWQDWTQEGWTIPALRQYLSENETAVLAIKRVPNARLFSKVRAVELLQQNATLQTIHKLRTALQALPSGDPVDPEDLWALSAELPYHVDIHWSGTNAHGYFDVVFRRHATDWEHLYSTLPAEQTPRKPWHTYANNPLQAILAQTLVPQLRALLQETIPDSQIPQDFIIVDTLPRHASGEIDIVALPNPAQMAVANYSTNFVAPRNKIEETVARLWAEVFNMERVGIHDNFFELGGQSLRATQLLSRLRQTFRVDLPLRTLFESSTVASLAEIIGQRYLETSPDEASMTIEHQAHESRMFPLSFAQQRLWYVDQLGVNATYNIFCALSIAGKLNIRVLQASLNEIVRRHEILRSRFIEVDGQPFQIVEEPGSLPLQFFDLHQSTEHDQDAQVQNVLQEEIQRSFDLAQGPLLRATLLQLSAERHIFALVIHHSVFDGWSLDVFMREMTALYQAFIVGSPSPLQELPIQYRDFARWQRQWLQGEHYAQHLAYWKQRLGPNPPTLELPLDKPRPVLQTYHGAAYHFTLARDVTQALRQLSQQENVTLFTLLLAAFQVLLHLYSGQDDIIVGTPVANRERKEVEDLIGFFVNMLVIRTDISGHPSFRELVRRVHEAVLGAHEHQAMPFEKLVEELQIERDPSRSPLFQIMFLLDTRPEQMEISDLQLRLLPFDNATAKFDLSLMLYDTGTDLQGDFEYNTDVFEAHTIIRMAEHFTTFLQGVVEQPETKL